MITKLVDGDTVLVKHPTFTDGKWEKGQILKSNDHYEIRLSNFNKTLYISKDSIILDINVIKVDSNFSMSCNNCKYWDKPDFEEPCYKCLGQYSYWEPCDSLKNKGELNGLDINVFSIDEGPFTDKKVDYSYISTNLCEGANKLARRIHDQLSAGKLKIEKLDMASMYPDLKGGYKLDYSKNIPYHSDCIDALRYSISDPRAFAEFMADFNKKENKNMKKQQKKRDRNIIKVKDLETRKIKEVMFNGPATIIKWDPTWHQLAYNEAADKTVTVAKEPDKFDKTTGFLLAVLKELVDNQSYGNILEKIDEINKFDEEDLKPKYNDEAYKYDNKTELHCSIKDLTEETEALENVYVPGSVVKYKNGKKYYKVLCYRFDGQLKELVYVLRPYKGTCFTDNNLEGTCKSKRNIPHSKLIRVRRK